MNVTQIPKHISDRCEIVGGVAVPRVVARGTAGKMVLVPSTYPKFDEMICWEGENDTYDFARYDDEKKRVCVIESRCHVCWDALVDPLICEPKGFAGLREATMGRDMGYLFGAPWVCPRCLLYSAKICPRLRDNPVAEVYFMRQHKVIGTSYKPAKEGDPVPMPGSKALLTFRVMGIEFASNRLADWVAKAERRHG
jgi:hypothetical protein